MKFRSIQSIGILAILGALFSRETFAGALVYSGIDRITPISSTPQPLRVSRRPKLAPIPNMNVYYAPDLDYNLYMADKAWYLLHDEKWYQGQTHEGPWRYLGYSKVPEKLKKIPAEFIKKAEARSPEKKTVVKKKPAKPSRKKTPKKSPR